MQPSTLLLTLSAALLAHAQNGGLSSPSGDDGVDDYLSSVCMPANATGYPDMNAPCNEVAAVQFECILGPSVGLSTFYAAFLPGSDSSSSLSRRQSDTSSDDPVQQSNETQRVCVCESQFFDLLTGCIACEKAHGASTDEAAIPADAIASMSSAYCAASTTPTADLANFLNDYASSAFSSFNSTNTASSTTFSDPIGNKTDVSLYYTQAVTGSSAWLVASDATVTPSSGSAAVSTGDPTTTNVVGGQIKPTASGAAGGSSTSASGSAHAGSATGTSSAGAMRTEAAAVAGVLGFAGLVALL